MVRVCPLSAGGFSPVVAWAVHVSVGKKIQRVTIASGGRERGNLNAAGKNACSTYITTCFLVEVMYPSTIQGCIMYSPKSTTSGMLRISKQ